MFRKLYVNFKNKFSKASWDYIQISVVVLICLVYSLLITIIWNPKGWDFPVYLNIIYNLMQSPFTQQNPIFNSIFFTLIYFFDHSIVHDPILSFKIVVFLISVFYTISLIILSKVLYKKEISTKHKYVLMLLFFFFIFSPIYLSLMSLYRQFLLILFNLLSVICIFQIYTKFEKKHDIKSVSLELFFLLLLTLLSNLTSTLSLITTIALMFVFPTVLLLNSNKNGEIKKKIFKLILIFSFVFFFSIVIGDLLSLLLFNNPVSSLSPFSYAFFTGIKGVFGIIGITISDSFEFLIISIVAFLLFICLNLFSYIILNVKTKRKIDFKKGVFYFLLSMFILQLFLSILFENERGLDYPGYQFSLFFIWGGMVITYTVLYNFKKKFQDASNYDMTMYVFLIYILLPANIIRIFQLIAGGEFLFGNTGGLAFPISRIHWFLIIPLSILAIKKILTLESHLMFFMKFIITYFIIGIIILTQIPIEYIVNLDMLMIYRELNSLSKPIRAVIWGFLIVIPNLNIPNRFLNKESKFSRNYKILNKKQVFKILVNILILFQIVSTFGIAIGLPPVIQDHELQFIKQIDPILEDNDTIAVAYHKTQWFILTAETNCTVIQLCSRPRTPYETSYEGELILEFIQSPTNQTLEPIFTYLDSSFYIWISTNPRYMHYAPYNLTNMIDFQTFLLVDSTENNFLFYYNYNST